MRAGNAVKVGEINDEEQAQADQLADQIPAALPSCWRQRPVPTLLQRRGDRHAGGGHQRADVALEGVGCSFGCGWSGRKKIDGGCWLHGGALDGQWGGRKDVSKPNANIYRLPSQTNAEPTTGHFNQ